MLPPCPQGGALMNGLEVAVLGLGSVLGITLQAGFVIVVRKSMSFGTTMEGSLICIIDCKG